MKRLLKTIWKNNYLYFLIVISIGAIVTTRLTGMQALQSDGGQYFSLAQDIVSQRLNFIEIFFKPSFYDLGYPFILSLLLRLFGSNNMVIYQLFNFLLWFTASIFIYEALKLVLPVKRAFWGSFIMACSPVFLTFSAKFYSEPLASFGLAIIIYFLIKYKLEKKYLALVGITFGMMVFFFTRSVFTLLVLPIFYFSLTRKNIYEYLIIFFSISLLILRLYFSIAGGRSNYQLAVQSFKVYQSYSTIGACTAYNLSYPVGKFVFPKFEKSCSQNETHISMPEYAQNPYVLVALSQHNYDFGTCLRIIFSDPIKYLVIVLSSMTSIIFIEGIYNVPDYPNSLFVLILFACIKIAFSFYIWSRVVKNLRIYLEYGLRVALLSIIPLIYFFIFVGNSSIEQRFFFPLLPWVYFYAALDKNGIHRMLKVFSKKGNF
jgi:hypothetical protein